MLDGDQKRLRLVYSLLLSLPGTPVLLYGDEIGLTEDLSLEGRLASRVPMDWDEAVRQARHPDSLLQFVTHLVHARRTAPEFGWGASTLLENEPPALFAHRCDWQGSSVFTVHNLSGETVEATLDLGDDVVDVDDLLELREHRVEDGKLSVTLDGYGYLWLRAVRSGAP
jgi:glycosidase